MQDKPDLAALIGSRICHDLISPIGAIGNGVELLMMDGAAQTPELALIAESVANANARIRFFRLAFGANAAHQKIARSEILSILAERGFPATEMYALASRKLMGAEVSYGDGVYTRIAEELNK